MHVEFNNRKNFPLPSITSHSTMDAGTESKLRERGGTLRQEEGLGGIVMFLNRTGVHVCPFVQDRKGHLITVFGQHPQGTLSRVFCAVNDVRVR